MIEQKVAMSSEEVALKNKGNGFRGAFKKNFWNSKSFIWTGVCILLAIPPILQLSVFASLGLSLLGSQHRYYDGEALVDGVENFVRLFVIVPAFILGPILIFVGGLRLAGKMIFKNYQSNGYPLDMLVRFSCIALVTLVCFSMLPTVFFLISTAIYDFQVSADGLELILPFPEVLRA